jgi:hypothetical protein
VRLTVVAVEKRIPKTKTSDLIIKAQWKDGTARFAVETKSQSTPKEFDTVTRQAETYAKGTGYLPMIILPYLRESQLLELEERNISGIDLCGNGVVVVPGRLIVFRTGNPNQFRSSAPIKNIYRRNTSMVGRSFLSIGSYPNLRAVRDRVNTRNLLVQKGERTPMIGATAWKALKGLQDDLIVERRSKGFQLLQADKLLEKLVENYEPPKASRRIRLKVETGGEKLQRWFAQRMASTSDSWIMTGISSVELYAVMAREEIIAVYCTRLDDLREVVGGKENDRFPNVELIEVNDEPVYFDPQDYKNLRWASPVQCYLELMAGDKRDQETAEQVKDNILKRLRDASK